MDADQPNKNMIYNLEQTGWSLQFQIYPRDERSFPFKLPKQILLFLNLKN